ncbi:putative membrane protein [Opitutaceae bacterium TAV1]|nr:putative membrane protein [Opitutaceae bacterium TAV1]
MTRFRVFLPSLPPVTLSIAAAALLVAALPPGVAILLQFDRAGFLAHGAIWPLFTSHLVHFGQNHLAWDVFALLVLGTMAERRSRFATVLTLSLAAPLIVLTVWIAQPQFITYRGLSGLDAALFALVATGILRDGLACRPRHPFSVALGALALAGLIAKCSYEIFSGATLFVHTSSPADTAHAFIPVPLAHLAGGVIGAMVGFLQDTRRCPVPVPPGTRSSAPPPPAPPSHGF